MQDDELITSRKIIEDRILNAEKMSKNMLEMAKEIIKEVVRDYYDYEDMPALVYDEESGLTYVFLRICEGVLEDYDEYLDPEYTESDYDIYGDIKFYILYTNELFPQEEFKEWLRKYGWYLEKVKYDEYSFEYVLMSDEFYLDTRDCN